MVVMVPGKHIEDHSFEESDYIVLRKAQLSHYPGGTLVAVRPAAVEIIVSKGTQCLHVYLVMSLCVPVETTCHEVESSVFFEKKALLHIDSGILCHEIVCVLDSGVLRPVIAFFVSVSADTVEFDQPITIAPVCGNLA